MEKLIDLIWILCKYIFKDKINEKRNDIMLWYIYKYINHIIVYYNFNGWQIFNTSTVHNS